MLNYTMLKEFLLIMVLLIASYTDIKKQIVTNKTLYLIILIGMIDFSLQNLFIGLILGILFCITAVVTKSLGGGDVKLVAVCGLVIGVQAILGITIGLSVAIILVPIINRIKRVSIKTEFPLVPYITAGIIISTIISNLAINLHFQL